MLSLPILPCLNSSEMLLRQPYKPILKENTFKFLLLKAAVKLIRTTYACSLVSDR